jgi:hypothetical protein
MEGEIVGIYKNGKRMPFFRGNEDIHIEVSFAFEIDFFEHQRLILRDAMHTIGFGFVIIPLRTKNVIQ